MPPKRLDRFCTSRITGARSHSRSRATSGSTPPPTDRVAPDADDRRAVLEVGLLGLGELGDALGHGRPPALGAEHLDADRGLALAAQDPSSE